jgi:hypothetical protein
VRYFLSLVQLLVTYVSLRADTAEKPADPDEERARKKKKAGILLLLAAVTFGGNAYLEWVGSKSAQAASDAQKQSISELNQRIDNLPSKIALAIKFGATADQLEKDLTSHSGNPKAMYAVLDSREEANGALQRLPAAAASGGARQTVVQYFAKGVDQGKVDAALRELGLRVIPGAAQLPGYETNAIWFGPLVPIDDVKRVFFVLSRAGVQIRGIRPFRNATAQKSNLIQVGSSADLAGKQPLTVREVAQATSFTR